MDNSIKITIGVIIILVLVVIKVVYDEKGHEWEAAVKSRTINKTGCPYCSHNKVLAGFNDFATLLPDIAAEWSDRHYPLLPTQAHQGKDTRQLVPCIIICALIWIICQFIARSNYRIIKFISRPLRIDHTDTHAIRTAVNTWYSAFFKPLHIEVQVILILNK